MASTTITNYNYDIYRVGDTWSFSGQGAWGYITNSGKDVDICFVPPNLLTNVNGFTVSSLETALRGFNGTTAKYVGDSYQYKPLSDSTVSVQSTSVNGGRCCVIQLRKTSAFSLTNNTPIFGMIGGTIKFT